MLGQRQKYQGYQCYAEQGNNEEIEMFYKKTNVASVLGRQEFVSWLKNDVIPKLDERKFVKIVLSHSLTMTQIIKIVAEYYGLDVKEVIQVNKGPNKGLLARKVAMYVCQQWGGNQLNDIMIEFGLSNIGSVSYITSQIRHKCKLDAKLVKQVEEIKLCIIKQVT